MGEVKGCPISKSSWGLLNYREKDRGGYNLKFYKGRR